MVRAWFYAAFATPVRCIRASAENAYILGWTEEAGMIDDIRRSLAVLAFGLALALGCGSQEAQEAAAPAETGKTPPPVAAQATPEAEPAEGAVETEAVEEGEELVESGTFHLEAYRASFIGSAGYAKGVLRYKGKSYPFKATGLGAGGFGVSKSKVSGTAYNIKNPDDFTGAYVNFRSGVTVTDESMGRRNWVKNDNGVVLSLSGKSTGLQLNLGADAFVVSWDD